MKVQLILTTLEKPAPHSVNYTGVTRVVWTNTYVEVDKLVGIEIHTRARVVKLSPSVVVEMEVTS